jgi:RHS repeat-associated protein
VKGSEITKYYFAGTTKIAMRKYIVPQTTTLTYLLGDHLGSTSLAVDASTNAVTETRYKPFGEVRYTTPNKTLPTRFTFTAQYSYVSDEATDLGDAGFGLMYYNARFYDPYLNHFTQPDTIVPDPSNSQAWDRYAYAFNNPLRYTDPTGHAPSCDDWDGCHSGNGNRGGGSKCTYHLCSDTNLYELGWKNFGSAWSIYTNPKATAFQRTEAWLFMAAWGDSHGVVVIGGAVVLREGVIVVGTELLTNNPDAATVSLGNYPAYIKDGYTYFDAGKRLGDFLDAIGLLKPMNCQFMCNQMALEKPMEATITSLQPGVTTLMEMGMLQNSKLYTLLYTQISSDYTGIINIFAHINGGN